MLNAPRWLLALVSIAFATFHALLGALSWRGYDNDWWLAASIVAYLVTVWLAVSLSPGLAMGPTVGVIAAVGAVSTTILANLGIAAGQTGTYASWYVGGMGVLLGIASVRGQVRIAWISAAIIATLLVQKAGFGAIGASGLVGMVVLIAAGQATAKALARADREVEELQRKEQISKSALVASEAASRERQERLRRVLTRALPALSYISSNLGRLSNSEKDKVLVLEAELRDEIRGRKLINEQVQKAAAEARARGIEVLLLDEGGLDEIEEALRENVLTRVVSAINSVRAGKVVVRAPKGEAWMVTLVASRPGTSAPDLWLKF